MLIVVNPIRNLNHYYIATLHKLNYESNSRSVVFILANSLLINIIHVQCTYVHTLYSV